MRKILQKFLKFFKEIPNILRRRYFLALLAVLLGFLAWGSYIFWEFGVKTVSEILAVPPDSLGLSDDVFERVIASIKTRQASLSSALTKNYPDIFR